MALNRFMHPRNIYKNPPDFVALTKSFEEFSKIAKMDITGKVTIDFKDPHSLRILTKCLLKKDFNLNVTIPEDKLVPTLPLRMNYILWVEDLLTAVGKRDGIRGLDIGTGACAIYPLLGAVKNKWHMVATESDKESLEQAKENVERNNLQALIQLRSSPSSSLLDHLFVDGDTKAFDFSMCNPPFYSSVQELCESRSPARLPPKNAFTGSPHELITDGGELSFCRKMIEESKLLQDKVLIFTTMVGHKYNLKELEQDLIAEGTKHTTTEFCQGRVTRWGLAWTYQNFDLKKLVPPRDKARKQSSPMVFVFPELPSIPHDIDNVSKKIKSMLQSLNIKYKVLSKKGKFMAMDIVALINTWTNQRRKRRLMNRLQGSDCKKPKLNGSDSVDENLNDKLSDKDKIIVEPDKFGENKSKSETSEGQDGSNSSQKHDKCDNNSTNIASKSKSDTLDCGVKEDNEKQEENKSHTVKEGAKSDHHNPTNKSHSTCEPSSSVKDSASEPVVHAILKLLMKENEIFLEMEFLGGSGGKEGVHQIVQYIKNYWK